MVTERPRKDSGKADGMANGEAPIVHSRTLELRPFRTDRGLMEHNPR